MEQSGYDNGHGPLHWVEEALIEAWAAPSAPSTIEGENPWYSCYVINNGWKKGFVDKKDDPTHGIAYYYNETLQSTQWERPNGYHSDSEDTSEPPTGSSIEQLRMEKWLNGDLDGQQEAINIIDRCIELLTARGDDAHALSIVINNGSVSPERLLSSRSSKGRPLLVEAARRGAATCVALLLDAWRVDIDACTSEDLGTALHHAAYFGQYTVVETLLKRGPSLMIMNKWHETPAQAARAQGHEHCGAIIDQEIQRLAQLQENVDVDIDHNDQSNVVDSLDEFDRLHSLATSPNKGDQMNKDALQHVKGLQVVVKSIDKSIARLKVGDVFQFKVESHEPCEILDDKAALLNKTRARYEGSAEAVVLLRIGRSSENSAVLSEINVSKRHATIAWLPRAGTLAIRDEGSQRGIRVRDKEVRPTRLGDKRPVAGEWVCLEAGDEFAIGSTTLSIDLKQRAPSSLSSSFVPSQKLLEAQAEVSIQMQKEAKKRESEVKEKKRHMQVVSRSLMPPPPPKRRLQTAASSSDIDSEEHVGRALLSKMGWRKGDGLGKHNNGISTPIQAQVRADRAGLGVQVPVDSEVLQNAAPGTSDSIKKADEWKKRLARYTSVCHSSDDSNSGHD